MQTIVLATKGRLGEKHACIGLHLPPSGPGIMSA